MMKRITNPIMLLLALESCTPCLERSSVPRSEILINTECYSNSGATVHGLVLTASGEPIPKAIIFLVMTKGFLGATSAENGVFDFGSVPSGEYAIVVEAAGQHNAFISQYYISEDATITITAKLARDDSNSMIAVESVPNIDLRSTSSGATIHTIENGGVVIVESE